MSTAESDSAEASIAATYTEPGPCPECGMFVVRMGGESDESENGESSGLSRYYCIRCEPELGDKEIDYDPRPGYEASKLCPDCSAFLSEVENGYECWRCEERKTPKGEAEEEPEPIECRKCDAVLEDDDRITGVIDGLIHYRCGQCGVMQSVRARN